MGIIKRNQQPGGAPPPTPATSGSPAPAVPTGPAWTPETVEMGQAPERRSHDRSADRRRGYRRIEDKDLITKAHEEAIAIREQAEAEGFEQGMHEAEAAVEELRGIIRRLMNAREEALLSVSDDIASIAVQVAERILKTEVACDPTLVMSLVRDTILKAGRKNKTILVKVNPEDVAVVKHSLRDDPIPNVDAELIVMEEPTVDAGSCIVETNSGMVDASFSTQLTILKQLFGLSG